MQLAWQSFCEEDQAVAAATPQLLKASPGEETHCHGRQDSQGSAVPNNAALASDVSVLHLEDFSFADEVPRPQDSSQEDVTSEVAPDLLLDFQKVSAHLEKAGELLNGLNARVDKAATRARKSLGGG